jgi:hypothetical protein
LDEPEVSVVYPVFWQTVNNTLEEAVFSILYPEVYRRHTNNWITLYNQSIDRKEASGPQRIVMDKVIISTR